MTARATAHRIIHANRYLTLATTDVAGRPWASPVYYTPDGDTDFYWVSRPAARHSRNIADRPDIAMVVYDSHQTPGDVEAVYLAAHAEQVADTDLDRCARIFRGDLPELATFQPERLRAPRPLRLYRARVHEASVLLRENDPHKTTQGDIRQPVDLADGR